MKIWKSLINRIQEELECNLPLETGLLPPREGPAVPMATLGTNLRAKDPWIRDFHLKDTHLCLQIWEVEFIFVSKSQVNLGCLQMDLLRTWECLPICKCKVECLTCLQICHRCRYSCDRAKIQWNLDGNAQSSVHDGISSQSNALSSKSTAI